MIPEEWATSGRNRKLRVHIFSYKHEAELASSNWGFTLKDCPSDILPLARLHHLESHTQYLQHCVDQIFKFLKLWEHISQFYH